MRAQHLLILTAMLASPAYAQLYKCVQSDGRIVYQDSQCETSAKQSTLRAPEPSRAAPAAEGQTAPAPGAAAPAAGLGEIVAVLAGFQGCANDLPGWAPRHAAAYNEWRARNQPLIARFNQDAAAQQKVKESLEAQMADAPKDARGREDRGAACDQEVVAWFTPKPAGAPGSASR